MLNFLTFCVTGNVTFLVYIGVGRGGGGGQGGKCSPPLFLMGGGGHRPPTFLEIVEWLHQIVVLGSGITIHCVAELRDQQ